MKFDMKLQNYDDEFKNTGFGWQKGLFLPLEHITKSTGF